MESSNGDPKLKMIVSLRLNVLDVWKKERRKKRKTLRFLRSAAGLFFLVIYDKQTKKNTTSFLISKAETRQNLRRFFPSLAVVFVADKNVSAKDILTNRIFF